MSNETVVFNLLHDAVAVRAIVGSRIFPIIAPAEAAPPFIVYSLIYASSPQSLASIPGIDNRLVQVDLYSETHAELLTLRDSARAALETGYNTFRGEVLQERDPDTYFLRSALEFSLWLPR
jgi:hypothetical protein